MSVPDRRIGQPSSVVATLLQTILKQLQRLTQIISNSGGSGVQSVTGDGVGGTPTNVVLTYPTPADIGAQTNLGFTPSRRLLYKNNASTSVTGTTSETIMDSILIPANTFGANDIVNIMVLGTKVGTAGTLTMRLKANSTPVLLGATNMLTYLTAAANLWLKQAREIIFKNSLSSQIMFNQGITTLTEYGGASNAASSLTVDFSVNQYLFVSFQNSNNADTSTLQSWYIEIIRN